MLFKGRPGRTIPRILALLFAGLCSTNAVANSVQLEVSATYALPPGITEAIPLLRFCINPRTYSRLLMAAPLAPFGVLSQQVFFPKNTTFVSPGVELRDNTGTTHYAYCLEQVPYSLNFTTLHVVLDSITTQPYAVHCQLRIEGGQV